MPFVLQPFAGQPPDSESLRHALGLDGDYLYVTATSALEWRRRDLAPPGQQAADGPQLLFNRAVRHLIGTPPQSRTEELVSLRRTADEIAAADPGLGGRLRHDAASWQGALAGLDERGIDPTTDLAAVAGELVHPRVGDLLAALHAGRRRHAPGGREPFERAARAFLAGDFLRARRVVMEGFTFLRPLQEFFARRCNEQGAEVVFVYPRRAEQAHGFAALGRTFAGFLPRAGRPPVSTPLPAAPGTALHALQTRLFGDPAAAPAPADDTVTAEGYGHRHAEVAACVRRLREYLAAGTEPGEVAVVVRDPAVVSLLQEEAARLQGGMVAGGIRIAGSSAWPN